MLSTLDNSCLAVIRVRILNDLLSAILFEENTIRIQWYISQKDNVPLSLRKWAPIKNDFIVFYMVLILLLFFWNLKASCTSFSSTLNPGAVTGVCVSLRHCLISSFLDNRWQRIETDAQLHHSPFLSGRILQKFYVVLVYCIHLLCSTPLIIAYRH